jgi:Zn-finger nucleic acid-binding protein
MKCPRDDAPLATSTYEAKIEIDTCGKCGGVWLDSGELEKIQETVERDYRAADRRDDVAVAIDAAKQEQRHAINCPKCGGGMTARRYGMGSAIVIDVCDAGCGTWLDKGELEGLEKFFEDSRNDTEIPVHWRMWASVVSVFKRK